MVDAETSRWISRGYAAHQCTGYNSSSPIYSSQTKRASMTEKVLVSSSEISFSFSGRWKPRWKPVEPEAGVPLPLAQPGALPSPVVIQLWQYSSVKRLVISSSYKDGANSKSGRQVSFINHLKVTIIESETKSTKRQVQAYHRAAGASGFFSTWDLSCLISSPLSINLLFCIIWWGVTKTTGFQAHPLISFKRSRIIIWKAILCWSTWSKTGQ